MGSGKTGREHKKSQRQTGGMASSSTPEPPVPHLKKPLRCIIKLGGAAITWKNELERINEEAIRDVSSQIRRAMDAGFPSCGEGDRPDIDAFGMDWSRRNNGVDDDTPHRVLDRLRDHGGSDFDSFIVVHGAGSFGHFQASMSGVHKGGLSAPVVKAGFVATRISVTSLNHEIVRHLARDGVPTVGMSPFACGWSTSQRNIASASIIQITEALNAGFIPVLHGDAVLDVSQGCTILSGDVIIRYLAEILKPDYVVFLTDVLGVYDRPPTDPNAIILKEIDVQGDGKWSIGRSDPDQLTREVQITVASHDTTGGMETKISEAAAIAKLGINVYITKAGTENSLRALKGEIKDKAPDDWFGTIVRLSKCNSTTDTADAVGSVPEV